LYVKRDFVNGHYVSDDLPDIGAVGNCLTVLARSPDVRDRRAADA
jgi:hypothetical protein